MVLDWTMGLPSTGSRSRGHSPDYLDVRPSELVEPGVFLELAVLSWDASARLGLTSGAFLGSKCSGSTCFAYRILWNGQT